MCQAKSLSINILLRPIATHLDYTLQMKTLFPGWPVASSIKDVFDKFEPQKIADFIKETRFYKKL